MANNQANNQQLSVQIQQYVQKEARKIAVATFNEYATKFGVSVTPLHKHNGLDSPRINAWDLVASQAATGNITMSNTGLFEIGLNVKPGIPSIKPSQIRFQGIVYHTTTGTIDIRSLVVGDAFVGPSFYLQPLTSSSVTVGGPPQPVIQSCSYLLVNSSGTGPAAAAEAGEGHIIDVTFNGSIVARATIPDLGDFGLNEKPVQQGNLIVNVSTLASGWTIQGNWVIL